MDLAQVLRRLPPITDPAVLVGTNTADDAGVYLVTPDLALVQTVDVFTPIVDEPYWFGAIAAANAMSDVYAMGGAPRLALNFAGFPRAKLPLDVLIEILRGGADKCAEAGVTILGGHTIDDPEPKYGLAVTGFVHPKRIITNATARPGDRLVLTKPLGMGVITTGIKLERTSPGTIEEATRIMAALNRPAAEAMSSVGVSAATDVTGFGLLGHLHGMARASRVGANIRLADVPILEEAWDLARRGIIPGGTQRNRTSYEDVISWDGLDEEAQVLLCDAQTSGGLLIAVPAERLEALLDALRMRGVATRAVIGEITGAGEGEIEVTA
jgi:selenide, water dikinase